MTVMSVISRYAIAAVFLAVLIIGMYKEVKVYDVFVEGAKEGVTTMIRILPTLVGLLVAIAVFRESGALDFLIYLARPLSSILGIPSEAMPLFFMRPISGSASLVLVSDILKTYGPDSYIGRVASVMMGSTETIFYTLAVYFGAVGIRNIRYVLFAALMADVVSAVMSAVICKIAFGT